MYTDTIARILGVESEHRLHFLYRQDEKRCENGEALGYIKKIQMQ